MEIQQDNVLYVILIILFNSFGFSIVSTSWLPNRQSRDLANTVMVFYSLAMLTGMVASIRAKFHSNRPNPEQIIQRHTTSKVRIISLSIFLVATLFLEIMSIIEELYCLSPFIDLGCTWLRDRSFGLVIFLCIKVIYLCTQSVYLLWIMPKLSAGQTGISSGSHLINIAINISLLIHNLIYEAKVIFEFDDGSKSEQTIIEPSCIVETTPPQQADQIMQCFNQTMDVTGIRERAGDILRPMMTEYFFLVTSILIDQWIVLTETTPAGHESGSGTGSGLQNLLNMDQETERESILSNPDSHEHETNYTVLLPAQKRRLDRINKENDTVRDRRGYHDFTEYTETSHIRPTDTGANISFVIMLILFIATVLLGIGSMGTRQTHIVMLLLYEGFLLLDISVACILIYRLVARALFIDSVILKRKTNLGMGYENLLFIASSCGVILYDFAKAIPSLAAFTLLNDKPIIKNLTSETWMKVHLIFPLVVGPVEIVLTTLSILMVLLLHKDEKYCFIRKYSPVSFVSNLYIMIFGSMVFWAFKSTVGVGYSSAMEIPKLFYGNKVWDIILHIVNPLAVYYHFHVALVTTEYLMKCYKIQDVVGFNLLHSGVPSLAN